ncbi:MAG: hypothetical protein K8I30_22140 [Anaerolineae bacterium]|nr:hypothetical protein [Anaerolineae bacterium]
MLVKDIIQEFRALSIEERKNLLKLLVDSLTDPQETATKIHSIMEFEGVTAHLADDEDPQDTINRLRDEWDDHS